MPVIAAVLILIMEIDGKECVLLTKRSSKLRAHPSQICFPGGKKDLTDKTVIETAIRESQEEIGLVSCQPFHVLPPCVSAHGLLVYPVLAKCTQFKPVLNIDEVDKLYYFEFRLFLEPKLYDYQDWDMKTSRFYEQMKSNIKSTVVRLHQFEINKVDTVWGLTSEFGIQAATFYYNKPTTFERFSPLQTMHWFEITRLLFLDETEK